MRCLCCRRNTSISPDETIDQESNTKPLLPPTSPPEEPPPTKGVRRLFQSARPQTKILVIGCIVLLIRLPFSLSIPHFVAETLSALAQNDYDKCRENIIYLLIAGTVDSLLDFWCVYTFGRAEQQIVRRLRLDTFGSMIRQELAFFDARNSGDLSSRLTNDCSNLSSSLTWFFRFSIEAFVRVMGIATYMMLRDPILGMCVLLILPIVALVNKKYGAWLSENAKLTQTSLAESNCVAQEAFSNIHTVLSFASEEEEHKKFQEKIEQNYDLQMKQVVAGGIYYMTISTFLINTCVQAAILSLGALFIHQNRLTPEVLLAFMLYQGQFQQYSLELMQSYTALVQASGRGDKVFEFLDRKPRPPGTGSRQVLCRPKLSIAPREEETEGSEDHHEEEYLQQSIEFRRVQFAYPSRPDRIILNRFDLRIDAGTTVALVGPSGCGKSTVMNLMERLYDPNDGVISFDDIDIRERDIGELRRHIGIVTQEPVLFSGTIHSNITYGKPNATHSEVIQACELANAHNFISSFPHAYETAVGERGTQLSGGQKQRIAIARAIIKHPSLLLLDEATSALDSESERSVQDALDKLLSNKEKTMTVVVIAHRLQTVRNADRIVVMKTGAGVVETGCHEELMRLEDGYYRAMVELADDGNGLLPGT